MLCVPVGGDHKSVSSVYLSDKLVSAVHSTLRGHMKGISVHTFPKEFLVIFIVWTGAVDNPSVI